MIYGKEMIRFVTGDIIESNSSCLVNTVNCEGFMGKGIAYQFKKRFPENEKEYIKACRNGQLTIGKIFVSNEDGKIIINFPTKDKWREKSQYSFIEQGMNYLVEYLKNSNIKSIAIPPLGCGNGGLEWINVKSILLKYLEPIQKEMDIAIYEPSKYYKNKPLNSPKLTSSHLLLIKIKGKLDRFSNLRLHKTAFFMNLFADEDFFKFDEYKYGPYSHSIDICGRTIKEFQDYYSISTVQAESIVFNNLVSESVVGILKKYEIPILKAASFANSIHSDKQLEIVSTILYLVKNNPDKTLDTLYNEYLKWPKENINIINEKILYDTIMNLEKSSIICNTLLGFRVSNDFINSNRMPKYNLTTASTL